MLSEYYWEINEEKKIKVIRIVAIDKENSIKKIRQFYQGDLKLLEIRSINY